MINQEVKKASGLIERQKAIDLAHELIVPNEYKYGLYNQAINNYCVEIMQLPSAHPDNHEVACLLAELFGDTCACNFNDIDEWLPERCEFLDACPDPGGVTCWEQFLKHRAERKNDE